jgi:hypothetical protein
MARKGIKMKQVTILMSFAMILMPVNTIFGDEYIGEYEGQFLVDSNHPFPCRANVVAEGPGYYRLWIFVEDRNYNNSGYSFEVYGVKQGNSVNLFGRSGSRNWLGSISQNTIKAENGYYGQRFSLKKMIRKSPTEGLKPPANAFVILPYEEGQKTDLDAWQNNQNFPADRILEDGSVQMDKTGGLTTKQNFSDIQLHLEFMIPHEPLHLGQHRANSGVFLNGLYEVQILDSFGLISSPGDCGAIYGIYSPLVNASLPPLVWQTYDISFRAARLDENGQVKQLPRITVRHNGVLIQDDVEIPFPTANPKQPHVFKGPINLQDHSNPVRFRNIWLVETDE